MRGSRRHRLRSSSECLSLAGPQRTVSASASHPPPRPPPIVPDIPACPCLQSPCACAIVYVHSPGGRICALTFHEMYSQSLADPSLQECWRSATGVSKITSQLAEPHQRKPEWQVAALPSGYTIVPQQFLHYITQIKSRVESSSTQTTICLLSASPSSLFLRVELSPRDGPVRALVLLTSAAMVNLCSMP